MTDAIRDEDQTESWAPSTEDRLFWRLRLALRILTTDLPRLQREFDEQRAAHGQQIEALRAERDTLTARVRYLEGEADCGTLGGDQYAGAGIPSSPVDLQRLADDGCPLHHD